MTVVFNLCSMQFKIKKIDNQNWLSILPRDFKKESRLLFFTFIV